MKRTMRKWAIFAALTGPVVFASNCALGLREALIEGGFAFVEESAVEVLQSFLPIEQLLEGEEEGEHE